MQLPEGLRTQGGAAGEVPRLQGGAGAGAHPGGVVVGPCGALWGAHVDRALARQQLLHRLLAARRAQHRKVELAEGFVLLGACGQGVKGGAC